MFFGAFFRICSDKCENEVSDLQKKSRKISQDHKKKQVNQVASISAALNEKLAAPYRVHQTLPAYLFFFTFAYHGTEEPWF